MLGCAAQLQPDPIVSSAALGQVVIYRNGVAYFERFAPATETEVTLRVPRARVDDFLKSLSVVDTKTGEPMPVSYPTLDYTVGVAQMTIKLPPKHNGMRITYVTESPSWKPSYRLVLDDEGGGQLLAWAIVDNVTGEDWDTIKVGVGSTSALSFRYNLHSIKQVHRETLESGSFMAVAPPTGGSPQLDSNPGARLVFKLSDDELQQMVVAQNDGDADDVVPNDAQLESTTTSIPHKHMSQSGRAPAPSGHRSSPAAPPPDPRPRSRAKMAEVRQQQSRMRRMASRISSQLRRGNQRVVIEGFAQRKDTNAREASLTRANVLRNELIANGVPADRIEAIGTGSYHAGQAVKATLVAAAETTANAPNAAAPAADAASAADIAAATQPLGQAHFVSAQPMTIARDHSAMVSILNDHTKAQRIYFYDPISKRGSKDYAFNAVRLTNPTKYTLDGGPITIYKKGQFLGEGLSEAILPGASAFIPYALDRTVIIEPEHNSTDEIDALLSIQRGIVTATSKRIHKTTLSITNRGQQTATVYVRHRVQPGYQLHAGARKVEKLGGAHLFPVTVAAGQTFKLVIEEATPKRTTINIRNDSGVQTIALYLRKAKLSAKLKDSLDEIVRRHFARADLEEHIHTMTDQSRLYRTRVDELSRQLVKLRKVPQAEKLRQHLSDKMQEISEKLQTNTLKISELKGDLMTARIELQDALAELTLKNRDDAEVGQ